MILQNQFPLSNGIKYVMQVTDITFKHDTDGMSVERHIGTQRQLSAIQYYHKVVLCCCWRTMKKHNISRWKRKKKESMSRAYISIEDQVIIWMHGVHRRIQTAPFFYKASRVPQTVRLPREVPAPIAHHWASQVDSRVPHWFRVSREVPAFKDLTMIKHGMTHLLQT